MAEPDLPGWILPEDDTPEASDLIQYYSEDIDFDLADPGTITSWLQEVVRRENQKLAELAFVFCSDEYLHRLNMEYLQHDTYTDIITFPYADPPVVSGDIFISIERVRENSLAFSTSFERELLRVIVHGVLHLCGYKDKTDEEEKLMREKEQACLLLYDDRA
jgi:rRNA maturation RNase YbeY